MELTAVFPRREYAKHLADYLLAPKALQGRVRSGLFLASERGTGKTTFLRHDLLPALQAEGAETVLIELGLGVKKDPAALVLAQLKALCKTGDTLASNLAQARKRPSNGDHPVDRAIDVKTPDGADLVTTVEAIIAQRRKSVVLVIDDVQSVVGSQAGRELMQTLKAARDAINGKADTPGWFMVVGVGSRESLLREMTSGRSQPFIGALCDRLEPLGEAYVEWMAARWRHSPGLKLPDLAVLWAGFKALGQRPLPWQNALEILQSRTESVDQAFPIICDTWARAAVDADIKEVQRLGKLAEAIFNGVVQGTTANGVYADEAIKSYARALGRGDEITKSQVQKAVSKLVSAGVVMREANGSCVVTDPLLAKVWAERRSERSHADVRRARRRDTHR